MCLIFVVETCRTKVIYLRVKVLVNNKYGSLLVLVKMTLSSCSCIAKQKDAYIFEFVMLVAFFVLPDC